MPVALASAVPVKTDHGDASPHPTMSLLVLILTIAPGIDSSISPTPCRRFIFRGQRTTSTAMPVMRSSPIAFLTFRRRCYHACMDFNLPVAIHTICSCERRSRMVGGGCEQQCQEDGGRDRCRYGGRDDGKLLASQGA